MSRRHAAGASMNSSCRHNRVYSLNSVTLGFACCLKQDSGRPWKLPGERAGSLRNPRLATSWDKKMADKAVSAAFKEAKQESISARKEKMQVRAPQ